MAFVLAGGRGSPSYTRIGRVTQLDGLVEALGPGSQRIGFALD
jgi:hypothetical protein